MTSFMDKIPLPANWDDPLIQSCAAFLELADKDMELDPELFQKAQARLGWAARELEMDPDQLQRAMSEHAPSLAIWHEGQMQPLIDLV